MVEKNLLYALNEKGILVSIDEVKNGLDCNCICPSCKAPLVARNNGEIREHHFAHYKNSSCATGYQTSLHLLAKELINEMKMIIIPPVYCDIFYENPNREKGYYFKKEEIEKERLLAKVDVKLEIKENGIIPDIIVQSDNYKVFVEIYVTHKVDETKKQIAKDNNIFMIEINLNKEDRLISKEKLSKYLFEDSSKSSWINNPSVNEENEEQKRFEKEFIKKCEEEKRKREELKKCFLEGASKSTGINNSFTNRKNEEPQEFEEWLEKEKIYYINNGKCPKCHSLFVRYKTKAGRIIFVCSENCNYFNTFSNEMKITIQKKLGHTQIYDFQQLRVHNGKCPKCGNNLYIRDSNYGPFVACSNYRICKAKIYKDLYMYLPDHLKKSLKEKKEKFDKNLSKSNESNCISIEDFLATYGSDE